MTLFVAPNVEFPALCSAHHAALQVSDKD